MTTHQQFIIIVLILIVMLIQLRNCCGRGEFKWYGAFNKFETAPGTSYSFTGPSEIPTKKATIERFIINMRNFMGPGFQIIFPGTLWCGNGNKAGSTNELGKFKHADACCRQHDRCPFHIDRNQKFGPLKNNGLFTRSACFCDRQFYECLKMAGDIISYKIGFTYFSILSPQCIGYDHPIIGCAEFRRFLVGKCLSPRLDDSKNKTLQWFDNPDFH